MDLSPRLRLVLKVLAGLGGLGSLIAAIAGAYDVYAKASSVEVKAEAGYEVLVPAIRELQEENEELREEVGILREDHEKCLAVASSQSVPEASITETIDGEGSVVDELVRATRGLARPRLQLPASLDEAVKQQQVRPHPRP